MPEQKSPKAPDVIISDVNGFSKRENTNVQSNDNSIQKVSSTEPRRHTSVINHRHLESDLIRTDSGRHVGFISVGNRSSKMNQNIRGGYDSAIGLENSAGFREYDHQVTVEFKATFLKINDIDTLSQQFEAEAFVQARWEERAFLGMNPKDVNFLLPGDLWDPLLHVQNVAGEFDHERRSFVVRYEEGYEAPVVLHRWRFKGLFKEVMELEYFPFDVQDLSLHISTERSVEEIRMKHDSTQLSSVNTRSFQDCQEWKIYKHVECTHEITNVEYASSTIHPILVFQCRVRRKVWYFIWNIVFIVLLVMVLSFLTINVDPTGSDRLSNTITLFLTMVAFKLVVKQSLPTISYLTYLDMYVLGSLIYLVMFAVENSAMICLGRHMDPQLVAAYDTLFCMMLGAVFIFCHLVFIIHVQITALKRQRQMKENDRQYQLQAQELIRKQREKMNKKAH